jgi:hypothetical protein
LTSSAENQYLNLRIQTTELDKAEKYSARETYNSMAMGICCGMRRVRQSSW